MTGLPADMHPERLSACFGAAISADLTATLLNEPRFSARLSDLVIGQYDLHDDVGRVGGDGAEQDRLLVALPLNELERLAMRAGIVFRAKNFLREIRGPVLAAFGERFGADALDDARRNVDLAGDRPDIADLEALDAAIRQDGRACLAGWIAALAPPMARRVRLKWPNDAAVPLTTDSMILQRGPAILRRLAGGMDRERAAGQGPGAGEAR